MTKPTITDMNQVPTPEKVFREGDMALIIARDGAVRTLAFDVDTDRLRQDPEEMSDEDVEVINQGAKLFALAMAAQNQVLMDLLQDIASDPTIVDQDKLQQLLRPN